MSIIRLSLLCALLLGFLPASASSQPAASQAEWINDLRSGGYVIVFRHGATSSDLANADPMSKPNVATQRQLNEQGRAQAKSIGESMRKLKIPVGLIEPDRRISRIRLSDKSSRFRVQRLLQFLTIYRS